MIATPEPICNDCEHFTAIANDANRGDCYWNPEYKRQTVTRCMKACENFWEVKNVSSA